MTNYNDKTIFIIEDDDAYAIMIEKAITSRFPGVKTCKFQSVERAISQNKLNPDIVVLDHFLKHTNGIDALPVVRDYIKTATIAVLSSQTDSELFSKAYEEGAKNYILKDTSAFENVIAFITKEFETDKSTSSFWKTIFNDWLNEAHKKTKTVTIVDDDKSILVAVKYNLTRNSLVKVETYNTFENLLARENSDVDVAILDYNIGSTNLTVETIEKIKNKFPSATLVCLSENQDIEIAVALKSAGIDYYLHKSTKALKNLRDILFN